MDAYKKHDKFFSLEDNEKYMKKKQQQQHNK